MYRSSMQTQPKTLRSSPGLSSAQLPVRGERTLSLHDVITSLTWALAKYRQGKN